MLGGLVEGSDFDAAVGGGSMMLVYRFCCYSVLARVRPANTDLRWVELMDGDSGFDGIK